MKTKIALLCMFTALAGCASLPSMSSLLNGEDDSPYKTASPELHAYKLDLANHIATANSNKMYAGRPQALLRSVVVVRYYVDANGNLARSEIMRSNKDRTTEAIALASLRKSAPFPKPSSELLQRGRVEVSETWLFNDDGRFQLRTTALPQIDR